MKLRFASLAPPFLVRRIIRKNVSPPLTVAEKISFFVALYGVALAPLWWVVKKNLPRALPDPRPDAHGERQRLHAAQLHGHRQECAHQDEVPVEIEESRPLISVAIRVACGAGNLGEPMP